MEAALKSRYSDKSESIEIFSEYPLGVEPPILDLLVIKKDPELKLTDDIGNFFREHNVIENKGFSDGININDVFKAQAYAGIYMSAGRLVDEIPWEKVTITAIQFHFPRAAFARLKQMNCKIEELVPNAVWEVSGPPIAFPFRVINAANLGDDWAALKAIAPGATKETLLKVQQEFEQTDDLRVKEYLKVVLKVSYMNNSMTIMKMKETGVMSDEVINTVKILFGEELEEMKKNDEAEKKRLTEANNQLTEEKNNWQRKITNLRRQTTN